MKIEVSPRLSYGHRIKGNTLAEKYSFVVNGNECEASASKTFCINSDKEAETSIEIPFTLTDDELNILNSMVELIIKSDAYKYNESHYDKNRFSIEMLRYIDIIIDGEEYEVNAVTDSGIVSTIEDTLRIDHIDKILTRAARETITADLSKPRYKKHPSKMSDDELKEIIINIIGTDDPFWVEPVFCIVKKFVNFQFKNNDTYIDMLDNKEQYTKKQLNDIYIMTSKACSQINSKYGFYSRHHSPKCPHCGTILGFLLPGHKYLYCTNCHKYFVNVEGYVGDEVDEAETK